MLNSDPGTHIRISWRWVAISAMVTSLAMLIALAVTTAVRNTDTLSTIALALAIVAFAIQICVFMVQTWMSVTRMDQSKQVNLETREILAEIRTGTQDTNDVLARHFSQLLNRVIQTTSETMEEAAEEDGPVDISDLKARLDEDIRRVVEEAEVSAPAAFTITSPVDMRRHIPTAPVVAELREWPDEHLTERLEAKGLSQLTDNGVRSLRQLGMKFLEELHRGNSSGQFTKEQNASSGFDELCQLNIISAVSDADGSEWRITLTGRVALRLVLPNSPPPQYVTEKFPWAGGHVAESAEIGQAFTAGGTPTSPRKLRPPGASSLSPRGRSPTSN